MTSAWRKLGLHAADLDNDGHDTTGLTNPMTTPGDLIVGTTAGAPARLAKGADSQVLTVDPTTHLLVWATPGSGVTFGTPAIVLGTAAAAGSIAEAIRRDSTIVAFDATVPVTQAFSDAAAAGSAAVAARRDHRHGMMASPGGSGSVATDAIFDAKGDLPVGTGADTAAKLTVGANDTILMADSAQSTGLKYVGSQTPSTQAFSDAAAEGTADTYARGDHKHGMMASPGGGFTPTAAAYQRTSANYTTTSTTFVAVDGTNMALTITTGARRCIVGFVGGGEAVNVGDTIELDVDIDGTRQGGARGLTIFREPVANYGMPLSIVYLTPVLSAGSHTFKLMWRNGIQAASIILYGVTTHVQSEFWVMEQGV